jgi:integrase
LKDAQARFKADKTVTTDRYVLKSFFRWARLKTIDLFKTKTVMEYMAYKVKVDKLVITSIRRLRETLHAFFNFVKRAGYIGENPVTEYKAPKAPEREIRFLSLRQIEGCLKAIEGHLLEPLIACAIFAGLRREELCWLTWDDVDLNERKPLLKIRAKDIDGEHWHPKNKKNRKVPISQRLHDYLLPLRPKRGEKLWVFPSPEGCRWDPDNLGHLREELMTTLKLPWTFLDFRHTFGSHLAMKGVSLAKIAKLMGNTVRVVEMHYASLQPGDMQKVVEFMECPREQKTAGAQEG